MALYPSSTLYPSSSVFPEGEPEPMPSLAVIRESPPLRTHVIGVTPNGHEFRWGADEPDAANQVSGLRWSSQMPGGWEDMSCTLPRKPGLDYSDLKPMSTLSIVGAGAEVCGEFRLERAPRVSGEQMSVSPNARGWQAHLEDDRTASMIYIDRGLSRWSGPSNTWRLVLINAGFPHHQDAAQTWDDASWNAALVMGVRDSWASPNTPVCDTWYDAGAGNTIAAIFADWSGYPDTNFQLSSQVSSDAALTASESSGDVYSAVTGTLSFAPTARYRYARIVWCYNSTPGGADGYSFEVRLTSLSVHGDHGLPSSTVGYLGYLASAMVAHAVGRWAPLLRFSTGPNGTVQPSSFNVPQAAFHDPTTVAAILSDVNRYELFDWAVWENREFFYHPRGTNSRHWYARVAPSGLEETGPQSDRMWNGILVQYQDVDGSTRTVGPPGSGVDVESVLLLDQDPENPANQLNIRRWDLLTMGQVSVSGAAIQVGARFLQEARQLDTSGRARFVGYVQDENGILWPYHKVRAGDTASFVDAADSSPRRIVRCEYDQASRSVSVDLDSPPEGLQALLARLGVALVPLGL